MGQVKNRKPPWKDEPLSRRLATPSSLVELGRAQCAPHVCHMCHQALGGGHRPKYLRPYRAASAWSERHARSPCLVAPSGPPLTSRAQRANAPTRPRSRLDLAALNRDRPRRNHRAALTRSRVRRCVPAALHPQWARRVTGRSGTTRNGTCRRNGAPDPHWAQPLW